MPVGTSTPADHRRSRLAPACLAAIIAAAIATATLAVRPAAADCPVSILWECGSDAGVSSTLSGATTQGGVQPWSVGQPCLEGCYDIVHGGLEAGGSGNRFSPRCGTGAWMIDDYWIEGPPSAQPLAFEAVLLSDVTITGAYGSGGAIWVGPESPAFFTSTSGPQVVVAGLSKSVGEVFRLEAHLETSGGGTEDGAGHATANLRFRGLPAGYSIVSCQGYALTTPAHPATWGSLKGQYR